MEISLCHLWEVKVDHHVHRLRLGKNEKQLKTKSQDIDNGTCADLNIDATGEKIRAHEVAAKPSPE